MIGASPVLACVLILVALAAVPVARRFTGDYFPPGALLVGSWAGTLGLYFFHVIPYPSMRVVALLFVVAAVATFVAGGWVGQRLADRGPAPAPTPPEAAHAARVALRVVAVGGLLGTAWYVYFVATILGADAFVDSPMRIRLALGDYTIPSRFLFLQLLCVAAPLLGLALHLTRTRLRPIDWLLVVACVLATWITTDRTQFFIVTLTSYFMVVLAGGRRLGYVRLVAVSVVAVAVLGASFLLIGAWLGKTPSNLGVQVQLPARPPETASSSAPARPRLPGALPPADARTPTSTSDPAGTSASSDQAPGAVRGLALRVLQRTSTIYLYATGSYAALDTLLQTDPPRTHGLHTFYPIARLLQRAGVIDAELPSDIAPFVPLRLTSGPDIEFNGYTLLYYPLSDFGRLGAYLYMGALGLLCGWVYGRYRRGRDSAWLLLTMGHLSMALVLSVFVNKFNNTASWYIYFWSCAPLLAGSVLHRR